MPSTLRGVAWMSGAVLSFCVMAISARELLPRMGVFEVLFFRTGVSFLIVVPVAWRVGLATLATRHFPVHLWRNLFHFGGQSCWVYAIGALPLAMVFAIEFTAPLWTALLAIAFLGERMTRGRFVMLALGFFGVLVVLRPGFGVFQPASLVMLLGALFFAVQLIGTKRLSRTESPLAVLFWMSVIQTPVCLAVALPSWAAPAIADLPWLVAIGCGNYTAHYCLTRAVKFADAMVVGPVDFFRLPFIAVIGALFYAEPFDPAVIAGAAIIFGGTYYGLSREQRGRRANSGSDPELR